MCIYTGYTESSVCVCVYIQDIKNQVAASVEDKLLEALIGQHADETQKQSFRVMLKEGTLDDRTIDVDVSSHSGGGGSASGRGVGSRDSNSIMVDASANPGFVVGEIFKLARGGGGKKSEKKKMTIAEARPIITENESGKCACI